MKVVKNENWSTPGHRNTQGICVSLCLSMVLLSTSALAQPGGSTPLPGFRTLATPRPNITNAIANSASMPSPGPLVPTKANGAKKNGFRTTAWTVNGLKEFNGLMDSVSIDLDTFFKDNPDVIADFFGGTAFNAWGSVKKTIKDLSSLTEPKKFSRLIEFTSQWWLWVLFRQGQGEEPQRVELGVEFNLCESPRVCQATQYLVANSLLNHWNQSSNSGVAFYAASIHNQKHSFMVALPTGVPPTPENVRIQGFIIDPFFSQSGDPAKILHVGSNEYYSGADSDLRVDSKKITRTILENTFNKNPLSIEDEETEEPTSPAPGQNTPPLVPPTVPVPPPNPIFCDTHPYARNPDGSTMYVTDPSTGNPVGVTPADMYAVAAVWKDPIDGTIRMAQTLTSVVECDWEKNSSTYLNAGAQYLLYAPSRGLKYNCLATYVVPAGTPYYSNKEEFSYTIEHCLYDK